MTSFLLLSTSIYCYGRGLSTCIKRLSGLIWILRRRCRIRDRAGSGRI